VSDVANQYGVIHQSTWHIYQQSCDNLKTRSDPNFSVECGSKFLNCSLLYSVSLLNDGMICLKYRVIILSENYWLLLPVGTFILLRYAIQLTTDIRGRVAALRNTQYLLDKNMDPV
jgi:hypothetical protein